MPADLAELEEYVGLERNPAGWEGITLVSFHGEVEYSAGNLFIGWIDDDWVVSCNLGPETVSHRFWRNSEGNWVSTSCIAY